MAVLREEFRVGVGYLEAATVLLRRVRSIHPTSGLFEAADLQWWWRTPRLTDNLGQLFWFDDLGRPEAAVFVTQWGETTSFDPIVLPNANAEWVPHVVGRGLAHARESGFKTVEVMVDRADDVVLEALVDRDFTINDGSTNDAETWLTAEKRLQVTPLHKDYRLSSRVQTAQFSHHMIQRSGPEVEIRLQQTSLYRPDLDLVILDNHDRVAAYGLFWFDPETCTGLVEPMRTEDDHQRRGLARHLLTSGIERLVGAGATRIKVVFRLNNQAARDLYLGVGFEPVKKTVVLTGQVNPRPW